MNIRLLTGTKEPTFANREQRREKYVVYYDHEDYPACCNFTIQTNPRICQICGNCCARYMAHEDGTYTCSACGKFPRELLLS